MLSDSHFQFQAAFYLPIFSKTQNLNEQYKIKRSWIMSRRIYKQFKEAIIIKRVCNQYKKTYIFILHS
jgi:hypothetical protein